MCMALIISINQTEHFNQYPNRPNMRHLTLLMMSNKITFILSFQHMKG